MLGQLGGPPAVDVEKLAQQMRSTADEWKKTASQQAFEELTTETPDDSLAIVEDAKADSVQDEELFKIAEGLPGDTFETYEALGGKYKVAGAGRLIRLESAGAKALERTGKVPKELTESLKRARSTSAKHTSRVKGGVDQTPPKAFREKAKARAKEKRLGVEATMRRQAWASRSGKERSASTAFRTPLVKKLERQGTQLGKHSSVALWKKLAFGQPMFQMQQQAPAAGGGSMGAMPGQQTAIKPLGPLKSPTAGGIGGGMKPMGQGQGNTNPMQQASTPKTPGAQGQGTQ